MKSNAKNCKVLKVNIKSKTSLNVGNRDIEGVDSSTYMGSNVTKDGGGTVDIRKRITMAGASFWMQDNILKITKISRKIKLSLFKNLVLSVLLYGCETENSRRQRKIRSTPSRRNA